MKISNIVGEDEMDLKPLAHVMSPGHCLGREQIMIANLRNKLVASPGQGAAG